MGGRGADAVDEAASRLRVDRGVVAVDAMLRLALTLHRDDTATTHRAVVVLSIDQLDPHIVWGERAEMRERCQRDRLTDLELTIARPLDLERDIWPVLTDALLPLDQLARQAVMVGVYARAEGESRQVE